MNYFALLGAVAPVFLIIAAGFQLRRWNWLTAEADRSLLLVGVNFLYPCLIADTVLGNPILAQLGNVAIPPVIGFFTVILGFGVCAIVAKAMCLLPPTARAFSFTTGLYNYGYLPIPLVQAFYSKDTLGVLFTHNLGVEIALWTVGVWILSGSSGESSCKRILNVPILAILASVVLNFFGAAAWIPGFVSQTMHVLGQTAIPIALLLTGATLADLVASGNLGGNAGALVVSNVLRLGLLPLAFLFLAKGLPIPEPLKRIMVIQAAMPSAMIPIVLAKHYKADSGHALQIVLSTTLLGLLTIPLWLRFGFWFVGL